MKGITEALSPSCEAFTATAATLMLCWDPGVRFVMTKEVLVVLFSSSAQRILYMLAFPSGFSQLTDTDVVVTLVTTRFLTTAGSAKVGQLRGSGSQVKGQNGCMEAVERVDYLLPWLTCRALLSRYRQPQQ